MKNVTVPLFKMYSRSYTCGTNKEILENIGQFYLDMVVLLFTIGRWYMPCSRDIMVKLYVITWVNWNWFTEQLDDTGPDPI